MDYTPTHHSKIVSDFIHEEELCIAFILAYSPELAPIEKDFSLLKRIVSKQFSIASTNWENRESMDLIKKMMQLIPSKAVISIWRHLMKELKLIITQIKS